MMTKEKLIGSLAKTLCVLILTCSSTAYAGDVVEVNVYSARKENLIKPLLDEFTKQRGVKVNLVTGDADTLLHRLKSEGRNSPADIFITVDAGRLHRAKEAGVLQSVESDLLTRAIPKNLRDPDGYWFGLSKRARVIFYSNERIKSEQLSDYQSLATSAFKQAICIRSSDNIYNQSLVASMVSHLGEKATSQWLSGFVANFARPPQGGDRDQIKAVAAGQCDVAVGNTYYYGQMLSDNDKTQQSVAKKVSIFWPNQKGHGTHINVSGVGLTRAVNEKSAEIRAESIKLMEFLVSKTAQKWYAEVNYEYPVRANVETSQLLQSWGEFKEDTLDLMALGKYNPTAVKLMDKAGWK